MKNTYFENMRAESDAWRAARDIRKAKKQELETKEDWDAVKAWNEHEKTEFPFPISRGAGTALRAYEDTNCCEASEFIVRELPWESGTAEDFVRAMKEAGITEFVTIDESTALMRVLHELDSLGCRMVGLAAITVTDTWNNRRVEKNGIRMRIV